MTGPPRRAGDGAGPSHPPVAAALLMAGIVLLVVALAAVSAW